MANATIFETALGWMAVAWCDDLLWQITFGHATPRDAMSGLVDDPVETSSPERGIRDTIVRLRRFAAGSLGDNFEDISIDTAGMTEFQRAVIHHCRRIPVGETMSYRDLAERAGHPRAARAVGSVMSRNRFPLVVPCHRVVSAHSLGGYSAPEGLAMKRRLLAAEADFAARTMQRTPISSGRQSLAQRR